MADFENQAPRVLVVMAHPDDPEFFCGGTTARWTAEGKEVIYLLLTRGDKGSDEPLPNREDLAQQREEEQLAAARVLGVSEVHFLDYTDGDVVPDLDLKRSITRVLRTLRPDVVVTSDPSTFYSFIINHSDHRAAGQATLDSVWPAARSALYFPELYEQEGLKPFKVREVYIAGSQEPNTSIEVTEFVEKKLSALAEHRSQIRDLDRLRERVLKRMLDPSSPPEAPRYLERFYRIEMP